MRNTELKDKIYYLENKLEHQEKMFEVKEQKARLEEKEKRKAVEYDLIVVKAENEQLVKRMDEHPYKLVSDMLKALVVKFPTLDIKDLAISTGKK